MKAIIYCPYCMEKGKRTIIGKHEEIVGRGDLYLYCRWCRKEIHIPLVRISLDR